MALATHGGVVSRPPHAGGPERLAFIDEHEWDALVSDENFYNSYRWLASLDLAFGPAEVLTVRGSGGLLAACPLSEGDSSSPMFSLPHLMQGVAGPWGEDFLWLGGRRNTHNELPCIAGASRRQALQALGDSIVQHTRRRGLAGFVMPYMPYRAALEFAEAVQGTVVLHSAQAVRLVPPGGLAGAMAQWNSHDRHQCAKEMEMFRQFGNRVEWVPAEALDDQLAADLIAQTRARHGSRQGRAWMLRILHAQRRAGVMRCGVAALARRAEGVTALIIVYRFGRALHMRYFGADYAYEEDDRRYFVLCYYETLDYAAAQGLKVLRLSTDALRAKVNRGARLEPQALVVRCVERSRIARAAVRRHNRAFLEHYRKTFSGHLVPDWDLLESETA
ncbi:peptidogalycan biosysnthesis protein [Chelativorans intermedius]|uniref:Peptidogalycan biosysnthesis protein n=1 Tax=Chelativorans intermedius TaxID=515947 RepID=A0ABV6D3F6_9HYPH|nr:peptidogalycan biosysnthesis protein [Chelativorans intermedius]MCT8998343.1 peptidogalycan biosysnthesis protein [Chelativorans intermedius]